MADSWGVDVDELRAALDGWAPAPTIDGVLSLARPAVQLTVGDGGPHAGTYGGQPALPAEVEWPGLDGQPLALVAQLDCAVVGDLLGPEWTLPTKGTLLFFYDDDLRADDRAARVIHVDGQAPARSAPAGTVVIPPLPLVATRSWSLPALDDDELNGGLRADPMGTLGVLSRAGDLVPHTPHQVLGRLGDGYYPQHPQVRPLLQVEGEEGTDWGECVRIAFVLSDEELRAARLDRVRIAYEVA